MFVKIVFDTLIVHKKKFQKLIRFFRAAIDERNEDKYTRNGRKSLKDLSL